MHSVVKSVHIIYASTSGHTEYVISVLQDYLAKKKKKLAVTAQRAELATEADLKKGDVLILASSTWNTGGTEGMLNPHMFMYIYKTVKAADLEGKPVAVIGCGDERYYYTCKAADWLEEYIDNHNGWPVEPTLKVINEPYGQEATITKWADTFLEAIDQVAGQKAKGSKGIRTKKS